MSYNFTCPTCQLPMTLEHVGKNVMGQTDSISYSCLNAYCPNMNGPYDDFVTEVVVGFTPQDITNVARISLYHIQVLLGPWYLQLERSINVNVTGNVTVTTNVPIELIKVPDVYRIDGDSFLISVRAIIGGVENPLVRKIPVGERFSEEIWKQIYDIVDVERIKRIQALV